MLVGRIKGATEAKAPTLTGIARGLTTFSRSIKETNGFGADCKEFQGVFPSLSSSTKFVSRAGSANKKL